MGAWSDAAIWAIIVVLGIGTYLLRWSFLGAMGNRPVPEWAQRALRYTAVAVLPALAAPQVLWPAATGGRPDAVRLAAAAVTVVVGLVTRHTLSAILGGGLTVGVLTWLTA